MVSVEDILINQERLDKLTKMLKALRSARDTENHDASILVHDEHGTLADEFILAPGDAVDGDIFDRIVVAIREAHTATLKWFAQHAVKPKEEEQDADDGAVEGSRLTCRL